MVLACKASKAELARGMFLGFLGGMAVAIMGAWKDTLYEDFQLSKLMRSPLIGTVTGGLIAGTYPSLPGPILLTSSIACERLAVEGWKAVIRKLPGKFARENRDTNWLPERLGV